MHRWTNDNPERAGTSPALMKSVSVKAKRCLSLLAQRCGAESRKNMKLHRIDFVRVFWKNWGMLLKQPWTARRSNLNISPDRKSVLNIHWKGWCWSWSSNTLSTWCEELTAWKRPRCWERLKVGEEGDDRVIYHQLDGHEFEQTLVVGDGQGSLACCGPQGSRRIRHN